MPSVECQRMLICMMLVPETSLVIRGTGSQVPVSLGSFPSQCRLVGVDEGATLSGALGASDFVSCLPSWHDRLPEGQSCLDGKNLWKKGLATVGHHLNPHHLPWAIEEGGMRAATLQGPTSNRIYVCFRPWDASQQ